MQFALKSIKNFANLNAQLLANKSKNAVRFESQNIIWDFEELNYQANALAKGLLSIKHKKNDNFLLRLPPQQQAEAYIAKLGIASIGANVLLSKASNLAQAANQLKNQNISSVLFEPTLPLGDLQYIDALNQLIPNLKNVSNGAKFKSAQYPTLQSLIQTNFYSYPGVYKFRSVLNYAEDKYFKITNNQEFNPLTLSPSNKPIIITDPAHDFAFRAATLNSMINGRYVIVVESNEFNRISGLYNHEVELVATQEIDNINPKVLVYVEKGSNLLKEHSQRVQI